MKLEGLSGEERKSKIIELVEARETVSVPEMVELFSVTGATIRNDLRELEAQNRLIRTHGGAVSVGKRSAEDRPEERVHLPEKKAIVQKALEYISDGDSLMVDTGTTTVEFARCVAASNIRDLKIITNDIDVAEIFETNETATVIMVGGQIRKGYHCTFGHQAADQLSRFSVDKAFMASTSFHIASGFSTPSIQVSEMKQAMIARAKQVIVMCDSSKLGKSTLCTFARVDDVDILITDDQAPSELLDQMAACQMEVVLADVQLR